MTNDDEFWFVLIFGGLFFGLVFISAVGQAYLYFFKRQRILSHLDNSLGVLKRKSFLSGGVFGAFLYLRAWAHAWYCRLGQLRAVLWTKMTI